MPDLPPIHKKDNAITFLLSPAIVSSDEYKSLGHKLYSSAVELCTFVDSRLLVRVCDQIPRETIFTERKENEITKWQEQWTSSKKGAVSKLFFPYIKERMKTMIPISAEFTAKVTARGLT